MKNSINSPLFLTFNRLRPPRQVFQTIRKIVMDGGVCMYPTDTCYALSCRADSAAGIEKIFSIKQRPLDKNVSIAFSDISMLERYAELDHDTRTFLHEFAPERFTLLLPKKDDAWKESMLLRNTPFVGARIPKDTFTRKLIQSLNIPLITTSANISGRSEVYTKYDITSFLAGSTILPDVIVVGHLKKTPPSTIIDTSTTPWKVVRQGSFLLRTK